ncbi:hypothetical protein [Heyndrickxia acidicola]|uniref:Uncharacterized protein n=1 Tax=Heyndrickxia acidicola TaxID=209389 RepID=A0ABU6MD24_9BACI|nr:hypothetical protein [Heyndrickxia acidicola]MED1202571.1 hypothetical protein [Heyndrickxia acidicola]
MRKFLTFGTSALAITMLSPTSSSPPNYEYLQSSNQKAMINVIEKTSSVVRNNALNNNIKTSVFNWNKMSSELFSEAREFTKEEAEAHYNALNKVSTIRGKRFNL